LSRRSEANEEFLRAGRHERDRNVPGLIGDLTSGQTLVREHVMRVLARLGASEAVPHIAKLADDPEETVRMIALKALGVLKARDFESTLVAGLNDPAAVVRITAADALGRVGARTAIPQLRKALDTDPDLDVRVSAVESLVLLGDKESRSRVPETLKALSWRRRSHPRVKRLKEVVETGEPLTPWIDDWWERPFT
jgi:HEAT repeat protein